MSKNKILNAIIHKCEPFYSELKNIITFHSSKIEGSTLSIDDNKSLITNVTSKEELIQIHEEKFVVENKHLLEVFDFIVDSYSEPLTHNYIKKIHNILCQESPDLEHRRERAGDYRQKGVSIGKTAGARPPFIHNLLDELINQFNNKKMSIKDIAVFHAEFETIHPFYDGNGRIGRMIVLKQCLQNSLLPIIVTDETKNDYIDAVAIANFNRNYDKLTQYFERSQTLTEEIYIKFGCKTS
jgi:Fic family protein